MFRKHRRAAIREHWRDWATLIVVLLGSLAAGVVTAGVMQLMFAGLVGARRTLATE